MKTLSKLIQFKGRSFIY